MSFGKAKRFVYKVPDVDCSPADYLICTKLDKGIRISTSPRFQNKSCDDDENQLHCPRYLESKYWSRNCENDRYSNTFEFNRNDTKRKSIKVSRKTDKPSTTSFNPKRLILNKTNDSDLYGSEEFIDDDYGSMTSSEEIDKLNDVEEYEFNEVYKAIKRIQNKRNTVTKHKYHFNFEDTVLKKLYRIDMNVEAIKEDMAYLPQQTFLEQLQHNHKLDPENTRFKFNNQEQSFKQNQACIKSLIREAILNLGKKLESKEKSILKDNEEKIIGILVDMYATNNNSSKQIRDLCNMTAEELAQNLNTVLPDFPSKFCVESEVKNVLHEFKSKCFSDSKTNTSMNLLSGYLKQTQEVNQILEKDFSDLSLKCLDTQQMLDVQELLLNEMKDEIENLKTNFKKN